MMEEHGEDREEVDGGESYERTHSEQRGKL